MQMVFQCSLKWKRCLVPVSNASRVPVFVPVSNASRVSVFVPVSNASRVSVFVPVSNANGVSMLFLFPASDVFQCVPVTSLFVPESANGVSLLFSLNGCL